MKTSTQIILGIAVVTILTVLGLSMTARIHNAPLGNFNVSENGYSSGVSYTTSSLGTNTAKSLLLRATSSRTYAKICNLSVNTVYLYKQTTSTGIALGMGNPIYATSSNQASCATYDANDPYMGQIWGITEVTSTVSIESVQN